MNFPKKFDIVSFIDCPYSQCFRYKNRWWRKTVGGSGELLKHWINHTRDCQGVVYKNYISIAKNDFVATEQTCLTNEIRIDSIEV